MANLQDKVIGLTFLYIATFVWVYYSIWVFVLPFVHESHMIHAFFLDRQYAIILPTSVLVLGVAFVGMFISISIINKQRQAAVKAKSMKSG